MTCWTCAGAVEQHADLAADLARELGQLAGQLVRDQAVGREAASDETLERLDLAGLEAAGVAEDLDGVAPGAGRRAARSAPGRACARAAATREGREADRAPAEQARFRGTSLASGERSAARPKVSADSPRLGRSPASRAGASRLRRFRPSTARGATCAFAPDGVLSRTADSEARARRASVDGNGEKGRERYRRHRTGRRPGHAHEVAPRQGAPRGLRRLDARARAADGARPSRRRG